jgi:CBS domain-containing protein
MMMTVQDVMTTTVVTVRPDTPLKEVARLLVDRGISGVPVVADDGTVLGVVSEADFLVKEQGTEAVRHRPLARILGESRESRAQLAKLGAVTAGDAMTSPAITIGPNARIAEAAATMTARRINRLPVVDEGRLVGLVSRADLVRAYVRTDVELEQAVREDVLTRMLWLDPASFTIDVDEGVVTIIGSVERRSLADMVDHAVRMVPGVVDVHVAVTWSFDDSHVQPASVDPAFPFGLR